MSDRLPAPDPLATLIAELREPVAVDPASKRRLMQLVLEEPQPSAVETPVHLTPGRSRAVAAIKRMRTGGNSGSVSASTLATAAGIVLVMAVGTQNRPTSGSEPRRRATVIGDSVASVASAIRDTLRIVQFMLTAPAASRVAVAGDFNGWDPRSIAMTRERNGRWAVSLALAPGRHNYAYVINDTQWVRDPLGTPAPPNELTPARSVVFVNR